MVSPSKVPYQTNAPGESRVLDYLENAVKGPGSLFDGIGFTFHPSNPTAERHRHVKEENRLGGDQSASTLPPNASVRERLSHHLQGRGSQGDELRRRRAYSPGDFTVTATWVRDARREARDAADEFYRFLRRGTSPNRVMARHATLTGWRNRAKSENAKNGAKFKAVYEGGGGLQDGGSGRDQSLASLTFYRTRHDRVAGAQGASGEKGQTSYLPPCIPSSMPQ